MPTNKQRREASRRHLERQLQERQERAARRQKITLIASIAGTVAAIGLIIGLIAAFAGGGSSKPNPQAGAGHTAGGRQQPTTQAPSPSPTTSAPTQAASYPCTWTKDTTSPPARKVKVPSTTKPPKKGTVAVAVKTNRGAMTFTLNRKEAPCTVASFVSLVKQGYFDKTPCHRLDAETLYILQCGDPTGTGTGGPGYTIPDETTGHEKYTAGTLAMANTGQPHSGGSQFFIVYKTDSLPPNYTIFGTVSKGLSVVKKVAAKGDDRSMSAGGGKPNLPISITSMKVAGSTG